MNITDARKSKNIIPDENTKIILSKHLGCNKHENVLIAGHAGSGKTYRFLRPNICFRDSVYIVADFHDSIREHVRDELLDKEYTFITLDLMDSKNSVKYDPMKYVTEDTIPELAKVIARHIYEDDFLWVSLTCGILTPLLSYIYRKNGRFCELADLLAKLGLNEQLALSELSPEVEFSQFVMRSTPKDRRKTCYCHLLCFLTEDIRFITNGEDTLRLDRIGENKKEVYFVNHNPADRSNNLLSSIFFYQAMNLHPGRTFRNHVTFVLDEFRTLTGCSSLKTGP